MLRALGVALVLWLAAASGADAAAITSNGTGGGNWASTSTWSGGVVPGSGDTVTIANGDTVTIAASTSVTVGSSPADDTGTPAIQCASSTGTGVLAIGSGGTLVYRGPIRLCNATNVGAGATLTHDSSLATTPSAAHYSWQQGTTAGRTSSILNLNGTALSRITLGIAAGSGYSGGFISGTPSGNGNADGGQLNGAYFDVTGGCGTKGNAAPCFQSNLNTAGDTFSIDHCTIIGNDGAIRTGQMDGAAIFSITNCAMQSDTPLTDTGATILGLQFGFVTNFLTNAKTTGTRLIESNFFDGYVTQFQGATSGFDTLHQGIVFDHNWLSIVSTTTGPLIYIGGAPNFDSGNWHDNLIWTTSPTSTHPAWNSPAGTLTRTYSLSDSYTSGVTGSPVCNSPTTVNYHINQMTADIIYDTWVFEPYADGSSKIQTGGGAGNGSTDFSVTYQNTIETPSGCGDNGGLGSAYLIVDSLACTHTGTSWCPLITFKQNTVISKTSSGAGCGNGSERTDYTSGVAVSQGNFNNIYWNPLSNIGCLENYTGTVPANTFVGTQDYNWRFNLTGTTIGDLYHNGGNSAYSAMPGAHDQSGNPSFVDSSRNFLKWCQTLDPSDTSWLACKAHFADIGTASHNSSYDLGALVDYVRAGFAPTNQALATAGNTGSFVGAVAPVSVALKGPGRMLIR